MKNIYFDYNPIYENEPINKYKNETDSDQEIIEKLYKSRTSKKLSKNRSAIELKGINKNNILPPIKLYNQNKNENNLRYYDYNYSKEKCLELNIQNDKIISNNEELK